MDTITQVPGLRVGTAEDYTSVTGCTVLLPDPPGAVCGVDIRGGAPGTRETALLQSEMLVEEIHGLLLAGGSAFGLEAAVGVMEYLREQGRGFPTGSLPVPIVPAAVLYDLEVGKADWPKGPMAYRACTKASRDPVPQGSVGAGCGATVGKLNGLEGLMKGGQGSACLELGDGVFMGALAVVNAFGDVRGPQGIIAGLQKDGQFLDTCAVLQEQGARVRNFTNTTLVVVATNGALDKRGANKVAQMAHNGLGRTVFPAHGMMDGDTVFALSTGEKQQDITALGAAAAEAVARAVCRAVEMAHEVEGILTVRGLKDTFSS